MLNRNLSILALSQGLSQSTNMILTTTSALIAMNLIHDMNIANVPIGLQYLATMILAIPSALMMQKMGRKKGFLTGVLIGIFGAILCVLSLQEFSSFMLFCVGSIFVGAAQAFALAYRFAAVEVVDEAHKSQAIAFVIAGGIIAAVLGPEIAKHTRNYTEVPFVGTMVAMLLVFGVIFISFLLYQHKHTSVVPVKGSTRPLREIISSVKFLLALACAMFSYGIMAFIMSATPLAMKQHHYEFSQISSVMQAHFLGMFLPSLFSGYLIQRFGALKVIFLGNLFFVFCVLINLNGNHLIHFYSALITLGIGWNFVFVGGTTILTETHTDHEKAKVQGFNDCLMYATIALVTFLSGPILKAYGWGFINIAAIPMMVTLFILIYLEKRQKQK